MSLMLEFVIKYRYETISRNLSNAFPDLKKDELTQIRTDYYKHLSRMVLETIRLWSMPKNELLERVTFDNPALLERYETNGKNVIIMMGHSGNWEWAGLACAARFSFQMIPVYRRVKNISFNQFYLSLRSRFGAKPMLDKACSVELPKQPIPSAVAMLADQASGPKKGWWLSFLNQETPFYRGSEVLARRLDIYDVVYAHVHRAGLGKYSILLEQAPDDWKNEPHSLTLGFTRFLEREVKKDPANWLWSHNRWKHQYQDDYMNINSK